MQTIQEKIKYVGLNWEKVPESFKTDLREYYANELRSDMDGLSGDDHKVILLLDRQKPSVQADYSFDEERISLNHAGKIIWGFDSGCSCPSPWHDSYPRCYTCSEGWKEFETKIDQFDADALAVVEAKLDEVIKAIV